MPQERYIIYKEEEHYPYFITCSIMFGLPIFSNPLATDLVIKNLQFLNQHCEVTIYAYVVMENHIHAILQGENLPAKICRFKSFTARKIIDLFKENAHGEWLRRLGTVKPRRRKDRRYQLWKNGYHPKQVFNDEVMWQKLEYTHNNPVKRGYVEKPEQWRYSSVHDYLGKAGPVSVTLFGG